MSKITLYESATPAAAPPAGTVYLYPKVDGRWYFMADDGTEYPMRPIGAGTGDLLADGSVPLTANWDVGAFTITALRFVSDVPTGTAPFTVASTTLVTNLNADQLDGNEATAFATAAQGALADTALQSSDIGSTVQGWSAVLDATTASFLIADETKLDGIDPIASVQSNLAASVAPTTTDDTNAGYAVGSSWWDTTNDEVYLCIDATAAAAVWKQVGSGTGAGGMTVVAVKTGNYTASENEVVPVDSSGGSFTVTMPPAASAQSRVIVIDVGKACSTYAVTLGRNSQTFDGVAADFVIDQNNGRVDAVSDGAGDFSTHLIGVPEVVNINDFATGFGGVNAQTGTTYTFADSDLALLVTASNAAASAYDIPDGLAAVGETLNLLNIGAGTVTIDVPGTDTLGSTLNDIATGKAATIVKTAATTWWVVGGA